MIDPECTKLAERLDALRAEYPEEWHVAEEPHDHPDGTDHFTHVRYTVDEPDSMAGATIQVADYLTPELAELLCLLHNNLDMIVTALRERRK